MAEDLFEPMPPLYGRWVVELLGSAPPRERRATCETCAMCAKPGETPADPAQFFRPDVKCCTFTPTLPNFGVGGVLSDEDPEAAVGRAVVEARIAQGVGVTPMGVAAPPVADLVYRAAADAGFGRSKALRCPYFVEDGGRCGVWRHRNSVCATWFCKHERGKLGFSFWRGSLQKLLAVLEVDLARWCVLELGPRDEALEALIDANAWFGRAEAPSALGLDGEVDAAELDRLWGEWRGREAEFYRRCRDRVAGLSLADALAVAGPEATALARLTREAFARLISDALPQRLRLNALQTTAAGPETTRIGTYSTYDPIDAPSLVIPLLRAFDGRPVAEVTAEIEAKTGVKLERSLIAKLVDFGVLAEVE